MKRIKVIPMSMSWLTRALQPRSDRKLPEAASHRRREWVAPAVEPLDRRVMMSVTATFSDAGGTLHIVGDDQDNVVVVSRNAGGTILVNDGAIPIQGTTPTVDNTKLIMIVGQGGNDKLALDETNGRLPGAALFGGAGNDTLIGGSGNDFAEGEAGNDTVSLGAGDDTFHWNPGDGSDVVDAGAGEDSMEFSGSDAAEKFDVSDAGTGSPFHHVRFTRDVGNVVMDLSGIESIDLSTLGGADTVTVNDQSATDLRTVNLDLEGSTGRGDGEADAIVLNGTEGDDVGQVSSISGRIVANASAFPFVNIVGAEGTKDHLALNALGGDDTLDASGLATDLIGLTLVGGGGSDQILGSAGNDQISGGPGNDKVLMGAGDDTFVWNPGDGSDVVEGQEGTDTVTFAAESHENVVLTANGPRVSLTDNKDNVVLDLNGIEQAAVSARDGADNITVNDLTGTALAQVKLTLSIAADPDQLTLNGSNAPDGIRVGGDSLNGVTVTGLAAQVRFVGALGASQGLTINGLGGADRIDASSLSAGAIGLTLNGGAGNDSLAGSQGDDSINGGAGTDTIDVVGATTVLPSDGGDAVNVTGGTARALFESTQRIGALTIGDGAVATLTPGGADVLTVTSLHVAGTGTLNLNDNALIVDYSLASPIASIQSLLRSGFHGGAWDGNGIMTGRGNASTFALGLAEASDVAPGGNFAGTRVDNTAVVVKFTRYGDANLDGKVDFSDLLTLAQHFARPTQNWSQGDFDYDGTVGFADLLKLAQNTGGQNSRRAK